LGSEKIGEERRGEERRGGRLAWYWLTLHDTYIHILSFEIRSWI